MAIRGVQAGLGLVVIAAVFFAFWWGWQGHLLDQETGQLEDAVAQVRDRNRAFAANMKEDGLTLTAQQIAHVNRRVEFANRLYEKRAFSWIRLLNDLAEAVPSGVSIQTVRLNFKDSIIQLDGTVLSLPHLETLVSSLENHGTFRRVKVGTHQLKNVEDPHARPGARAASASKKKPRTVVQFQLSVAYKSDLEE